MPCSRSTVAAAISTGSTVVSGRDPWPPWPCSTMRSASAGGHRGAAVQPEHARGQRHDVLAEHDVGHREPVEQAVVDHGLRALADLLGGLEDEQQRAAARRRASAASSAAAPSRQVTCMS